MSTLVGRLREAIRERRALAEALDGQSWTPFDHGKWGNWTCAVDGSECKIGQSCGCCSIGTLEEAEAAHIAANDPAQILRDCDAHLKILDELVPVIEELDDIAYSEGQGPKPHGWAYTRLLELLAEAYGLTEKEEP